MPGTSKCCPGIVKLATTGLPLESVVVNEITLSEFGKGEIPASFTVPPGVAGESLPGVGSITTSFTTSLKNSSEVSEADDSTLYKWLNGRSVPILSGEPSGRGIVNSPMTSPGGSHTNVSSIPTQFIPVGSVRLTGVRHQIT